MLRSILIATVVLAPASLALAQPAAPPPAKPGVTLPAGALEVSANLEINMSAEAVGKPSSLAPDVAYGVSDALTVALVHSTYGITGFRARTGRGLCLTGEDNGCPAVYNNVGAEAWYQLGGGSLALAAVAGIHALNLKGDDWWSAKLGLKLRYPVTPALAIVSQPSVFVAITSREVGDVRVNDESLWIPVQAVYKVTPAVSVGVGSGFKSGRLSDLDVTWEVPLGVMATYKVDPALSFGASWVFGALLGGAEDVDGMPGKTGLDPRGLQLWGTYRL